MLLQLALVSVRKHAVWRGSWLQKETHTRLMLLLLLLLIDLLLKEREWALCGVRLAYLTRLVNTTSFVHSLKIHI
jgi:hypothetical protein